MPQVNRLLRTLTERRPLYANYYYEERCGMYSVSDLLLIPVRLISYARMVLHICTDILHALSASRSYFGEFGTNIQYAVQPVIICSFATKVSSSRLLLFPPFPRQHSSKQPAVRFGI